MSDWTDEYKARMRAFMETHGKKVDIARRYDDDEEDATSVYGWGDSDALRHVRSAEGKYPGGGCHWVVPEGAVLYERTYSQFLDTMQDNEDQVGINVKGCRCACGRYQDVILRYTGTLAEVMREITGAPARAEVEL
jgi:hypothetical protein